MGVGGGLSGFPDQADMYIAILFPFPKAKTPGRLLSAAHPPCGSEVGGGQRWPLMLPSCAGINSNHWEERAHISQEDICVALYTETLHSANLLFPILGN